MSKTSGRLLLASSRSLVDDERFDLLIHALAQLPDTVTLAIWGDGPGRARLDLLARAYCIDDRVRFLPDAPSDRAGQIVYPSPVNARTAPLRPELSISQPITLDISADARRGGPAVVSTLAEFLAAVDRDDDPPASLRTEDGPLAGERVAVVTNHPAPYRLPLFERINERLGGAGSTFHVYFLADDAAGRSWMSPETGMGFGHTLLRSVRLPVRRRRPAVPLSLKRELDRFSPTLLLLAGFSPFVAPRVARYAARRNVVLGLWSGEHGSMRTARSRLRWVERRWLTSRVRFGVSYGSRSAEYLRGVRPTLPIVYARNTSNFSRASSRDARDEGIQILAVGDLSSPRKGIDVLIDALAEVNHLRCVLTVVGGGKLMPELVDRAAGDDRVRFLGPLPAQQVRELYGAADIFAFPSRADVFGLAPVEAMGSGLATLTSSAPGMVADLCVDGHNCLVIEGHEPSAWAAAIERLVIDGELRATIAAEGARTVERRWTIEHSADALIAGLRLGVLTRDPERAPHPAEVSSRQEERPLQPVPR